MKKILLMVLCLLLIGCNPPEVPKDPVQPEHSLYYNEKYSVEDVIKSFNEVVLKTEYSTGDGDASLVQRWDIPIYYTIGGYYKDEDIAVLKDLFKQLNAIPGFPGIYESDEEHPFNLNITFYKDKKSFDKVLGDFVNYESVDGAVRYWYWTDTNDIYEAVIGYVFNDTVNRKSVLLEEVINGLGISDTTEREDSIVYQYSSTNEELSEMDIIVLSLLYNERIRCGMTKQECETIIRELYY